jgi:hypothetical protein
MSNASGYGFLVWQDSHPSLPGKFFPTKCKVRRRLGGIHFITWARARAVEGGLDQGKDTRISALIFQNAKCKEVASDFACKFVVPGWRISPLGEGKHGLGADTPSIQVPVPVSCG